MPIEEALSTAASSCRCVGQGGLAVGFNSLWLLAALVPFYFVIRYGVVARERKFANLYLDYKSRVRRWL